MADLDEKFYDWDSWYLIYQFESVHCDDMTHYIENGISYATIDYEKKAAREHQWLLDRIQRSKEYEAAVHDHCGY